MLGAKTGAFDSCDRPGGGKDVWLGSTRTRTSASFDCPGAASMWGFGARRLAPLPLLTAREPKGCCALAALGRL